MFEQQIVNAIASILLQEQKDQWGNIRPSLLAMAIYDWAEKNKENITEEIIKKLTIPSLADAIGNRVIDVMKGNWGSSFDRDNLATELKRRVVDVMARQIAEEKLKEELKDKENGRSL